MLSPPNARSTSVMVSDIHAWTYMYFLHYYHVYLSSVTQTIDISFCRASPCNFNNTPLCSERQEEESDIDIHTYGALERGFATLTELILSHPSTFVT